MSHPQSPTRQPTLTETEKYTRAVHYASLASVVIAPILALLPPRKLDLYTVGLSALTVYSGNRLYRETHDGRSLWDRLAPAQTRSERVEALRIAKADSLPTDRARDFQRQYQHRMESEAKAKAAPLLSERDKDHARRTILERAYYGSEDQDTWKEKREREVQDKLAEGKGYGDIIMDQIWEVWNWGRGDDQKDERDK